MSVVREQITLSTFNGLYSIQLDREFANFVIQRIKRWRKLDKEHFDFVQRMNSLEQEERDSIIKEIIKHQEQYKALYKARQSDEFIHMAANDTPSKVLNFILGINYMYTVVDNIKDIPELYSKNLKFHLNQVEKELDKHMKNKILKKFYGEAESDDYMKNLDIMENFFYELSRLHAADLQATMVNFINEMQDIKTDKEYGYRELKKEK